MSNVTPQQQKIAESEALSKGLRAGSPEYAAYVQNSLYAQGQGYQTGSQVYDQFVNQLNQLNVGGDKTRQAVGDWLDYANQTGTEHMLSGFQFPTNLGQHDFGRYLDWYEQYGNSVGWRNLPSPQQLMAAYNNGNISSYSDAAKFWGANLPSQYSWVKHGMSPDQWGNWKEQNRHEVAQRFGKDYLTDANYGSYLDNPIDPTKTRGGQVGQLPPPPPTLRHEEAMSTGDSVR